MPVPKFRARIIQGKVSVEGPERFAVYLATLEGKEVELEVRLARDKRSTQANSFYWAVIDLIADHTGYTKDQIHECCKVKFLLTDEPGLLPIVPSTSEMDVKSFNAYMEQVCILAGELGITIPEPERAA